MSEPALSRMNPPQRRALFALLMQANDALAKVAPSATALWFDDFDDRSTWKVDFPDGTDDAERSAAAEFVKTWQPDWHRLPSFNDHPAPELPAHLGGGPIPDFGPDFVVYAEGNQQ